VEKFMSIRDILPNVTTLSIPFKRAGVMKIGGRATIVRLSTGNLAVISPTPLTSAVRTKITTLSPTNSVAYLIAPDLEHHISLYQWHSAFPSAAIVAPEGLAEKRAKTPAYAKQVVPITHTITAKGKANITISEEFDREFDVEFVDGHINKEIVLLHKPSKTMIQADFMWNLPALEQYSKVPGGIGGGVLQRIFTWAFGAGPNPMGQRRALWWGMSAGDRVGFNRSVERIGRWNFDSVVMCHGDVLLGNGREVFERVFKWHLEAAEGKNK